MLADEVNAPGCPNDEIGRRTTEAILEEAEAILEGAGGSLEEPGGSREESGATRRIRRIYHRVLDQPDVSGLRSHEA